MEMRKTFAASIAVSILTTSGWAAADLYPYVVKGPVITGVTDSEAWVSWYTAHHQGSSSFLNECYNDALTGTPNDTIPTLTMTSGGSYTDPECSRFHKAHLTGLSPSTAYSFTLDKPNADGSPAAGQFGTAPAKTDTPGFKFIVYGDDRNNPTTSTSTRPDHEALVAAMLARENDAAFLVNVGDYALNYPAISGDDRGYAEFYDVERQLLATHPIAPVFGNHESVDTTFFDGLMSAPTFAGAAHPYYFSFDWGRVHVACLDSFEGPTDLLQAGARQAALTDTQADWLDADLAAAKAAGKLLFIVTHQGAFSHGIGSTPHGGLDDVKNKVVPLMVKYGALGMFAGHDHYYERGHEACIDYVVTGAGGAEMYEPDPAAAGVAATFQDVSYVSVIVDSSGAAQAEAKDAVGNVVDQFALQPATCGATEPDAGATADADAGAPPDAPAGQDAALADTGTADAASTSEAGAPTPNPGAAGDRAANAGSDGGCACSWAGARTAGWPAWLSLAGSIGALALRRRRPQRSSTAPTS